VALSTDDLLRLEVLVRRHAEELRKSLPAEPATTPGFRAMDERTAQDARGFDAVGDLLMGLQGDWASVAPLVRRGYQHMAAGHEKLKSKDGAAA
jgi:hypothetical protein